VANKRTKRPTLHSFPELEAQLNELSGKSYPNEEAIPRQLINGIIGQIKEICSQLPFDPVFWGAESRPYAEWFCEKLRSRWRSSGDCLDYSTERTRLLTHLAEISTKKQRQILKEKGRQRHEETADRNIKLAGEFLRKYKPGSNQSASALKASIGAKRSLTRSAAIAAVDDGLRHLRKRGS
jgi:hypothetical protein